MQQRMVKTVTVTLTIETECDDLELIERAICSELSGLECDYDCVEGLPDGTDGEREECYVRIAVAETPTSRFDAGTSSEYQRFASGKETTVIGSTTFEHG